MSFSNPHSTPVPQATGRRRASSPKRLAVGVVATTALLLSPGSAFGFQQPILATDGAHVDDFGHAVDVDGDVAVVGAPGKGNSKGAVYVFQRTNGVWKQTGKLTVSNAASNDRLGQSVAIDGDVIVAGASGRNYSRGAVYTFSRTGPANRFETAQLLANDYVNSGSLGESVAIDGDKIVAGAPRIAPAGKVLFGAVYTFARTGAKVRGPNGRLIASDAASYTRLGRSVAIDGDTIVAGSMNGGESRGAVYTFARNGLFTRTQTAKLTLSNPAEIDSLGNSVAIQGDTIVAGAPYRHASRGAVYTFARVGAAARTQTAELTISNAAVNDHLGASVAITDGAIVSGEGVRLTV